MQPPKPNNALRQRSIGEILEQTFRHYRTNFRFLFMAGVYILAPYLILESIFGYRGMAAVQSSFANLTKVSSMHQLLQMEQTSAPGASGVLVVLYLLDLLVVVPLLFGVIVQLVSGRMFHAELAHLESAFAHAFRRLGIVIGTLVITYLLFLAVAIAAGAGLGILIGVLSAVGGIVGATLMGVVGGLAMLVLLVWFGVRLVLVPAVAFAEQLGFGQAIARSFALTSRSVWRTFGYLLLVYIIVTVVRIGVSFLLIAVNHNAVVTLVVGDLLSLFTTPFLLLAVSELYADLRVRTDELDKSDWQR